ncbi:SRPBCC family protein [Telluribacter humicola]|uniref:SRPBCC family protein n=1 Tax=Telluribacter humicola TaxID=1720261 RepID=UPI001A95FB4C|nr:SRPBCC domain-containing protein [Telluribacter humicola]
MKTYKFSVQIEAPREKVWEQLWSDAGYRQWTSAFCEGSYVESDWEEGSTILFLSPEGDGMFGVIEKKVPLEVMTFKHLGELKNGQQETKDWAGARESYALKAVTDHTIEVEVELDATDEFQGYFQDTFPKALHILKQISEQ